MSTADHTPKLVSDRQSLARALAAARGAGRRIGLVPTMGALHAGHLSLCDASRRECDYTVATIFVNPTQFGPNEDFTRYPRTLETDLRLLGEHAVDLVYAPPVDDVYRPGHAFHVEVGGVALPLEGEHRPGHFRGVATVVLKLFHLVPADAAFFGQKDYQQSLVIRQLVHDFDLPIAIRTCPIVRDADGLALSSRNVYLSADDRRRALTLSQSLKLAAELVAGGERDVARLRGEMLGVLAREPEVKLDYLAIADAATLAPAAEIDRRVVALLAARVGNTRLIDNELFEPGRGAVRCETE